MHYRNSRRRREKSTESIFEETMVENFPNLGKETNIQVQEAQNIPSKINPMRPTPRHTIGNMAKVKDEETILKQLKGKQKVTYKANLLNYQIISQLAIS